ncbi:MAG: hypothetical protein J0H42_27590 [Rhizobiales bacterium]|nr:hypothetical protein [Hyphomicrobiales bacterium]
MTDIICQRSLSAEPTPFRALTVTEQAFINLFKFHRNVRDDALFYPRFKRGEEE